MATINVLVNNSIKAIAKDINLTKSQLLDISNWL